jgi:4-hydroxy-4-methyl-2-oxoglutarate aldolase
LSLLTGSSPEAVIALTRLNPYDRLPDGRPRVPDDLLERMVPVTTEEAWTVLRRHGYHHQWDGNWLRSHPDRILVGRALTALFVPQRPDLHDLVEDAGRSEGHIGGQNSWVIDMLQPGDVLVADVSGNVNGIPFIGDNLATSIRARTRAGAVIDGTVRDFQGIVKLTDVAFFCRGLDPGVIRDVTLAGVNGLIRIGKVTVLPGDVVLGTPTGVIVVPPHLVAEVVEHSEETRARDAFGKQRLEEGRYAPGEIDRRDWAPEIEADYQGWRRQRS